MSMMPKVKLWIDNGGLKWISKYMPSLHQMIINQDSIKGVYGLFIIVGDKEICSYIGESGKYKTERTIVDRLCEHAYALSTDPIYSFGLYNDEIEKGLYQIVAKVLDEVNDLDDRLQLEVKRIKEHRPYTQDSSYRKYSSSGYQGIDLCIPRRLRRSAFEKAILL